ncbi:MAG: phosphoglycolate phosphatase [Proteobacteria bacterium]|nr:phosphoglycolate phosphatase [Pseudomonadota bacterium]
MGRIVVFDLDGTLAETAPDIMASLNHLLIAEGLAPQPVEAARKLVGAGARALIDRGFRASGRILSPEELDRLFEALLVHYLDNIMVESFLYPGVPAALRNLAEDGFRLAICTNKPEPHAIALVEKLGVRNAFALVAGRETFAYCKPDPRHLTETIRVAGGDPRKAILVGDSRTDVDTARAAGIPVIGVSFGYTDVPMAELRPDRIIDHFDELEAAIHAIMPKG